MSNIKNKVLHWLAYGSVGVSSKSMALAAAGMPKCENWGADIPHDPDDFNRCLLLLDAIPEIRNHFDKIALLSKSWHKIISNWDEIEKSFIDEAGFNWSKSHSAPETYRLMKQVIRGEAP